VPIVLKSVSLKLLEPSGPVKACNGIALPACFAAALQATNWIKQFTEHGFMDQTP
jgi:hypothetical protein